MARNYLLARGMELRLRCSFSGFKVHFCCPFLCRFGLSPLYHAHGFYSRLCAQFLHVFFTTNPSPPQLHTRTKTLYNLQQSSPSTTQCCSYHNKISPLTAFPPAIAAHPSKMSFGTSHAPLHTTTTAQSALPAFLSPSPPTRHKQSTTSQTAHHVTNSPPRHAQAT